MKNPYNLYRSLPCLVDSVAYCCEGSYLHIEYRGSRASTYDHGGGRNPLAFDCATAGDNTGADGGLGNGGVKCSDCLSRNLFRTGNSENSGDPAGTGRAV